MPAPMSLSARKLLPLLFGSGMCALVYQIAWFREFRMIFGASTAATAAVLAIFTGGLGVGGVVLGTRVDRHPRPIRLYGQLELLIAAFAATTPGLLRVARYIYIALGGTTELGLARGTALRLLLTALVLAAPTFLMGGTLPAAARGAEADDDLGRRSTGLLYGVNTLGAVAGCSVATFYLLETFGTRATLWIACAVNLVIGAVAMWMGTRAGAEAPVSLTSLEEIADAPDSVADRAKESAQRPPSWFTLLAAGISGFAFFLMELVWYRMLGPILGGTVFTFGLILAVALLGIGRARKARHAHGVRSDMPARGALSRHPIRARRPDRGGRAALSFARGLRFFWNAPWLDFGHAARRFPRGRRRRRAISAAHRAARRGPRARG
jgi:spermidine synthase